MAFQHGCCGVVLWLISPNVGLGPCKTRACRYRALALDVLGSRLKGLPVKVTIKIGFALLLAVLLSVNPIGACGGIIKAESAPSHPCCPKDKAPECCAKSSCFCTNAEPAAIVAPEGGFQITLLALDTNEIANSRIVAFTPASFERILYANHPRFLTFHQILV